MSGKYFNFSEVLGYGWSVMKENLWFFVGLGFVLLIVSFIPNIIDIIAAHTLPRYFAVFHILITILGWIIGIILGIGLTKIALSFCDGLKPPVEMLFDAWDCFWRYVGATILYGLIVLGGLILLIIPGIIWAIKYSLCYYFIIDKGLGPVQAIKASGLTTMGVKWQLFGFGIVCGLINLLGILCLLIGVFATYPTVMIATALVYRQLAAQTPELVEFGITTPSVEPAIETLPDEQEF